MRGPDEVDAVGASRARKNALPGRLCGTGLYKAAWGMGQPLSVAVRGRMTREDGGIVGMGSLDDVM
ncbi:hypothetical protein BFW41_11840 [Aeromonas hydrophila]|nr:hypothetical protein BFW41_11840 [Aeromonas hydrophila]